MKRSIRTGWLLSMMALSTLVACGDGADEPTSSGSTGTIMGDGGSGGSGGSGGGEAGEPSGVQACVAICEQHKMYGCDPPDLDCDGSCRITIGLTGTACDDEMAAMYSCELPEAPSCKDGLPAECGDEHDAAFACIEASGCWGLDCTYPNGLDGNECTCASTCLGKEHEVDCGPSADGTTRCACLVDGVEVGTCEGAVKEVCHLKEGCCNEFFNIPR
ncbi:hypothetical protein [Sorangium sp. So ce385]|uniref:hypothetical protein n=1 Tax=Sorangium sp. So ce385 TaxID=3133308 RepID=UPI003F5CA491